MIVRCSRLVVALSVLQLGYEAINRQVLTALAQLTAARKNPTSHSLVVSLGKSNVSSYCAAIYIH